MGKMADNERTVKLREAEIQTEVGKREEEARAAALIQRAVEEQKVMKERTQQQVEEAKVLLQVAEQQALTAQKEAEGTSLAELVEKQNASRAMLVEAQAEADANLAKAKAKAEESAIQAKGQAEALVLKEKNQTYQYMGEAGITDIVMNKMPEIAGAIAAPLSKTEKMVFISQDDATGSKVTKDIIKTIATLPDAVEGLTGLDLKNAIAKATRL